MLKDDVFAGIVLLVLTAISLGVASVVCGSAKPCHCHCVKCTCGDRCNCPAPIGAFAK